MPPLLTQVARTMDGLPLVSSQTPSPGFAVESVHQNEAKEIIRKMTMGGAPNRMSVDSGDRYFSYLTRDNLCFLVLTEESYPKRLAFLYLEDIADLVLSELAREFGNEVCIQYYHICIYDCLLVLVFTILLFKNFGFVCLTANTVFQSFSLSF